jgi:hypothetical protein
MSYKKLPNELREKIFLNSINNLQDLQQKCRVNIQHKIYCNKYFTLPIKPILESIKQFIDNIRDNPKYKDQYDIGISKDHIRIFTNLKIPTIQTDIYNAGYNNEMKCLDIYTNFPYPNILSDILKSIKTQNELNYTYLDNENPDEIITIRVKPKKKDKRIKISEISLMINPHHNYTSDDDSAMGSDFKDTLLYRTLIDKSV